jgi:hypothetical protein
MASSVLVPGWTQMVAPSSYFAEVTPADFFTRKPVPS